MYRTYEDQPDTIYLIFKSILRRVNYVMREDKKYLYYPLIWNKLRNNIGHGHPMVEF